MTIVNNNIKHMEDQRCYKYYKIIRTLYELNKIFPNSANNIILYIQSRMHIASRSTNTSTPEGLNDLSPEVFFTKIWQYLDSTNTAMGGGKYVTDTEIDKLVQHLC